MEILCGQLTLMRMTADLLSVQSCRLPMAAADQLIRARQGATGWESGLLICARQRLESGTGTIMQRLHQSDLGMSLRQDGQGELPGFTIREWTSTAWLSPLKPNHQTSNRQARVPLRR